MIRKATGQLRRVGKFPHHVGNPPTRSTRQLVRTTACYSAALYATDNWRHHDAPSIENETVEGKNMPWRMRKRQPRYEKDPGDSDASTNPWKGFPSPEDELVSKEAARLQQWFSDKKLRGQVSQHLDASKSWAHKSPGALLKAMLVDNRGDYEICRFVATLRSYRLPVFLLQMLIRQEEERRQQMGKDCTLLPLLPPLAQWEKIKHVLIMNGHKEADFERYLYILCAETDDDRCMRFLEDGVFNPVFILNFLLRGDSSISKASTLASLMDYCHKWYCAEKLEHPISKDIHLAEPLAKPRVEVSSDNFNHLVHLFSKQCLRVDSRLLVRLGALASAFIKNIGKGEDLESKKFLAQCSVFNETLHNLQPVRELMGRRKAIPNPYFWEAQRILLEMSGGLEEPLLVSKAGFRAIRTVLGGLHKIRSEVHTARLRVELWPPYIHPGDGIDEQMEPEESWSRAVRAGAMMQEAGFPQDEVDQAFDILQGLASDGTPTIQQRIAAASKRPMLKWEASIRATRNAHEAWERFRNPPAKEKGRFPGLDEYTAMLEKLCTRDANANSDSLPGDNALNYSTQELNNLTDFEKARLQPPSLDELYRSMLLNGIKPTFYCLKLLVSNAESLNAAHRYLRDSTTNEKKYSALLADEPDPTELKKVPLPLFAAYIDVCTRESYNGGRHLLRAIHMTNLRLADERSAWIPFTWAPIVKNLGQHHSALDLTLGEQLLVILEVLEMVESQGGISVWLLNRVCRTMKRTIRWEVKQFLDAAATGVIPPYNPIWVLFDLGARSGPDAQVQESTKNLKVKDLYNYSELSLMIIIAGRLKAIFNTLVAKEKDVGKWVKSRGLSSVDAIHARRDPVRAGNAYEYLVCLAYTGEFKEAARFLVWLMEQWGHDKLMGELESTDDLPRDADMFGTLCAFRALVEPMLEPEAMQSVYEALEATQVRWAWPDDEMVDAYLDGRLDTDPEVCLRNMLRWTREQQEHRQQEEQW